jgi:hypothetical protein
VRVFEIDRLNDFDDGHGDGDSDGPTTVSNTDAL